MVRPIDGNALLAQEKEWAKDGGFYTLVYNGFQKCIQDAPTLDYVPVRHGEWLLKHVGHGHYWECSECHTNPCIYVTENTKYRPNCGAKMDGGKENDAP